MSSAYVSIRRHTSSTSSTVIPSTFQSHQSHVWMWNVTKRLAMSLVYLAKWGDIDM